MAYRRNILLGKGVAQGAQVGILSAAKRPCQDYHLPGSTDCVPDKILVERLVGNLIRKRPAQPPFELILDSRQ